MRKLAYSILLLFTIVGLLRSCIASDLPWLWSYQGDWGVLSAPHNAEGKELRGHRLSAALSEDDWVVWAPISWSPDDVRGAKGLEVLAQPSSEHWLGTDDRGRDVASQLVHGSWTLLSLALQTVLWTLCFLFVLSLLAQKRGVSSSLVLLLADAIYSIPLWIFLIITSAFLNGMSIAQVALFIAIPRAAAQLPMTRAQILQVRERAFYQSGIAMGLSQFRLFLNYSLPQLWPQLRVCIALSAATALASEMTLSFLGLGPSDARASWGELMSQAHQNGMQWWLWLPPGILAAVVGWALMKWSQSDKA